ncbi:MAG: bifunctional 5,10-methylenetetrahydrofolate dehydrogenase/5,10-methenyltetrahydrofolate cyclohydrolase [Defluviitaleaceae bacterium]|nr:bifunctional 5,10-methylenetetrahydrofolate dehydrogenase/5,10-methenyltetrahydrofolate cyclohydrolase [Defluviitaleaceae bacterium]
MIPIAIILDGNAVAKRVRIAVKKEATKLATPPGLAVIQVGDDPASAVYVANKRKDCVKCGIMSHAYHLEAGAGESRLLELIHWLNDQPYIHGILVQLPLPDGYNTQNVIASIAPEKDVDAFHTLTVGRFYLEGGLAAGIQPTPAETTPLYGGGSFAPGATYLPCTPAGIMALLDAYEIDPLGKHAVVVGFSNIVGKPMSLMLLQRGATVTSCHIHTNDLAAHTRLADILVCAVGKPNLITADMVKPGAVVVDVGINRIIDPASERICGDVDFDAVEEIASYISPVPGGVGPMTRAMLMKNTLLAAQLSQSD